MAKILSSNKQYTGVSASVAFANGVGETDDPHLIGWFRARGYKVEEGGDQGGGGFSEMSAAELRAYAADQGIDIGGATSAAGIAKKILDAEKNKGKKE